MNVPPLGLFNGNIQWRMILPQRITYKQKPSFLDMPERINIWLWVHLNSELCHRCISAYPGPVFVSQPGEGVICSQLDVVYPLASAGASLFFTGQFLHVRYWYIYFCILTYLICVEALFPFSSLSGKFIFVISWKCYWNLCEIIPVYHLQCNPW